MALSSINLSQERSLEESVNSLLSENEIIVAENSTSFLIHVDSNLENTVSNSRMSIKTQSISRNSRLSYAGIDRSLQGNSNIASFIGKKNNQDIWNGLENTSPAFANQSISEFESANQKLNVDDSQFVSMNQSQMEDWITQEEAKRLPLAIASEHNSCNSSVLKDSSNIQSLSNFSPTKYFSQKSSVSSYLGSIHKSWLSESEYENSKTASRSLLLKSKEPVKNTTVLANKSLANLLAGPITDGMSVDSIMDYAMKFSSKDAVDETNTENSQEKVRSNDDTAQNLHHVSSIRSLSKSGDLINFPSKSSSAFVPFEKPSKISLIDKNNVQKNMSSTRENYLSVPLLERKKSDSESCKLEKMDESIGGFEKFKSTLITSDKVSVVSTPYKSPNFIPSILQPEATYAVSAPKCDQNEKANEVCIPLVLNIKCLCACSTANPKIQVATSQSEDVNKLKNALEPYKLEHITENNIPCINEAPEKQERARKNLNSYLEPSVPPLSSHRQLLPPSDAHPSSLEEKNADSGINSNHNSLGQNIDKSNNADTESDTIRIFSDKQSLEWNKLKVNQEASMFLVFRNMEKTSVVTKYKISDDNAGCFMLLFKEKGNIVKFKEAKYTMPACSDKRIRIIFKSDRVGEFVATLNVKFSRPEGRNVAFLTKIPLRAEVI